MASAEGRRPSPHPAAGRRQGPTATATRNHCLGLSAPGSESGGGQPIAGGSSTPVKGAHQSSDGTACPYPGGWWRALPVAPAKLPATTRGRPSPFPTVRQSAKRRPSGGGGTNSTQQASCPTREPAAPCHAPRRRPLLAVQSHQYPSGSRCPPPPFRRASRRGGGHRRAPTCPRDVPAALCPAVHRCRQRRPRAAPLHLYLGALTGPPRSPVSDMPSCCSGSRTPCRAAAPAVGGAVAPVVKRVDRTIPAAPSCMALRGRALQSGVPLGRASSPVFRRAPTPAACGAAAPVSRRVGMPTPAAPSCMAPWGRASPSGVSFRYAPHLAHVTGSASGGAVAPVARRVCRTIPAASSCMALRRRALQSGVPLGRACSPVSRRAPTPAACGAAAPVSRRVGMPTPAASSCMAPPGRTSSSGFWFRSAAHVAYVTGSASVAAGGAGGCAAPTVTTGSGSGDG